MQNLVVAARTQWTAGQVRGDERSKEAALDLPTGTVLGPLGQFTVNGDDTTPGWGHSAFPGPLSLCPLPPGGRAKTKSSGKGAPQPSSVLTVGSSRAEEGRDSGSRQAAHSTGDSRTFQPRPQFGKCSLQGAGR